MTSQKRTLYILGLGNPGSEYARTRHNAGRMVVEKFANEQGFPSFALDKKLNALTTTGKIGKHAVIAVLPETFMNKSGDTARALKLGSKKQIAESLIVVHDDLDLPVGRIKIIQNRGSAGHKGVESIMRTLATHDFVRIRIGTAKPTEITKSQSKDKVIKLVIGKPSPQEEVSFKKGIKKSASAITAIVEAGLERAMNEWN